MKTEAQINAFIAKGRDLAKRVKEFEELSDEYTATDAGNVIVDADFTGINEGLTNADMVNFQASVVNPIVSAISGASVQTTIQTYKAT